MSRFLLCGGDFCAFNLGLLARPGSIIDEMGCCNKGNGASGFGWHSTAREVCVALGKRLDGKLVVVTGSNAGVGLETAKAFYEIGATVVMACRSEARANDAANNIRNKAVLTGKAGSIVFQPLDLTSLASVESFAAKVNAMSEPMHALVCNAGIMAGPFALTPDGFERQFQVNYLSHFYLTMLLLDKLKAAPSRVVSVSSVSHGWVPFPGGCCGGCCGLCFGSFDLSGARFPAKTGGCCAYEPFEDYSYSKAAQVIMTTEIQRRLLRGTDTIAVALEPGLSVESGLTDSSACLKCVMNYTPVGAVVGSIMGKSLPQMASTVLYASLADGVAGGDYFRNVNLADVHGPAADPAYGPQLWELSCKAVQAKVPLFSPPPPVTMAAPRG